MAGNLWLALPQDFDHIADADLSTRDQVEEAQTRSIGKGRKERDKIRRLGPGTHESIIYALTDMSSTGYIRLDVYDGATMNNTMQVKEEVKLKYGSAARAVAETGSVASCCDPALRCRDPITTNLYSSDEKGQIPEKAVLASLGCGNPTALIELKQGEVVLDLGSGGGIDVLLSARRVGPTGKAYGLDMTDDMLALARENQRQARVENVEFLKGEIESIPLAENSVDVVISNCVINLSADKDKVLREAFRVLKPGGRFAVSDVVVQGEVPEQVRQSMLLWVGCVAGALEEQDYRKRLEAAGFVAVDMEPTRIYNIEDARQFLTGSGVDVDAIAGQTQGRFMSAFIRATKPALQAPGSCCEPGCCSTTAVGKA
jgi:arsenite methyltransferase